MQNRIIAIIKGLINRLVRNKFLDKEKNVKN